MIQRIQSVYLFFAALAMSLLFFKNIVLLRINGSIPEQRKMFNYLNDEVLDIYDNGILIALASLAVVLSLLAIFLFRRRKLQIYLSRGTMLVTLLFLVFTAYLTYAELSPFFPSIQIIPALGLFLPMTTIIFLILAVQGIRKDDKLVRSMDRLR